MSRSDQFIGLTQAAEDFTEELTPFPVQATIQGAFGDEFGLRVWQPPPWMKNTCCVREVIDQVPWSSGPMFFTCIEIVFNNGAYERCFEWTHDPRHTCNSEEREAMSYEEWEQFLYEYDKLRGTFWV